MTFVAEYHPLVRVRALVHASGEPLEQLRFRPGDACREKLRNHRLVFREIPGGFRLFYSVHPNANPELRGAIRNRTRFTFEITSRERGALAPFEPEPSAEEQPQLYFDNLLASGGIKTGANTSMAAGSTVALADTTHIRPRLFVLMRATPPRRFRIRPLHRDTPVTEVLATGEGTEADLRERAPGPYRVSTVPASPEQRVFLDDAIGRRNVLGVVDFVWDSPQTQAPAPDGLDYRITFKPKA